MRLGDLTSLFQLGVALNFGFGALISFVEPARTHRDDFVNKTETRLVILSERQENESSTEQEVEDFFEISRMYRSLYQRNPLIAFAFYFSGSVMVRSVFLVCGIASFSFLVLCSATSETKADVAMLASAVVLNVVPLFAAVVLFSASCWYQFRLMPVINEIEKRFEKYRFLLQPH